MLLCERFQQRFGTPTADGRPQEIMLKTAVTELGVSRRRLYDIINVLEAVEVRVVFVLFCCVLLVVFVLLFLCCCFCVAMYCSLSIHTSTHPINPSSDCHSHWQAHLSMARPRPPG